MYRQTIWHGTEDEAIALLRAMDRTCTVRWGEGERCAVGPHGERLRACASHRLLLDQRALDGLLWMRRSAERLRAEEFGLSQVQTGLSSAPSAQVGGQ